MIFFASSSRVAGAPRPGRRRVEAVVVETLAAGPVLVAAVAVPPWSCESSSPLSSNTCGNSVSSAWSATSLAQFRLAELSPPGTCFVEPVLVVAAVCDRRERQVVGEVPRVGLRVLAHRTGVAHDRYVCVAPDMRFNYSELGS